MTNKAVAKETKKCEKYAGAIDVMFKRYREKGVEHSDTIADLSATKANKVIEREIFQTLHTLESRNIVTRQ